MRILSAIVLALALTGCAPATSGPVDVRVVSAAGRVLAGGDPASEIRVEARRGQVLDVAAERTLVRTFDGERHQCQRFAGWSVSTTGGPDGVAVGSGRTLAYTVPDDFPGDQVLWLTAEFTPAALSDCPALEDLDPVIVHAIAPAPFTIVAGGRRGADLDVDVVPGRTLRLRAEPAATWVRGTCLRFQHWTLFGQAYADIRVLDWDAPPELTGETVGLAAAYAPTAEGRAGCR